MTRARAYADLRCVMPAPLGPYRGACRMNLRRLHMLLGLLVLVCCSASRAQDTVHVMKIGIGNPQKENNFGWTPFEVLENRAEALSNGQLQVQLYPQVMGISSMTMISMVQAGVVQARDFADGHLATIFPPIQVLSIPYLFADREVAWKVLDGPFGQRLIEEMARQTGLRPLCWLENGGFRHFSNSHRPIHSPEDMRGLRIRTMESPLHIRIVRDLGAKGVPIAWPNVYESLESGLVDGQENSIATFLIPHFEEIQHFIVLDGHFYGTYTLLMNDAWYRALPDSLKEVLNRAKRSCLVANRGLSVVNEMQGLQYLKTKNVQVYQPTFQEHLRFREATQQSAIAWLMEHVGEEWVTAALEATKEAEHALEYAP